MAGCCEHGIGHYKDLEKSAEWSSLLQSVAAGLLQKSYAR
jgi:hypothetical protein